MSAAGPLGPPGSCYRCGAGVASGREFCAACGSRTSHESPGPPIWRLVAATVALLAVLPLGAAGGCLALVAGFGAMERGVHSEELVGFLSAAGLIVAAVAALYGSYLLLNPKREVDR
jgi:O-antigen ligase